MYVRTFAGARNETSAHYNTGLVPVLTLQSHDLIEFLLLCDGCSLLPHIFVKAHYLHGQPSVGQWRTW